MARTRYIKPGFFKNEDLAAHGPWHRLLFAGLWTIADRAGRLEDRPKRIKPDVFPYDDEITGDRVDRMLSDLASGPDPFIVRYTVAGVRYLQCIKWLKHQSPHRNEAESILPSHRKAENTEQPSEFGIKDEAAPAKVVPDSIPNGEWGMGNGELRTGDGESAKDTAKGAVSARAERQKYGRPLVGSPLEHRSHGWCNQRGLCLPASLYAELLGRLGGPAREKDLIAWLGATIDELTTVPGETVWVFWRSRFEAWQGSTAPTTKGARTMAAGRRIQALLDSGAELDPLGTKADARERAALAAKAGV